MSFPTQYLKPVLLLSPLSSTLAVGLMLLISSQASWSESSSKPAGTQTAMIVAVQKHSEGRVFDWVKAGLNPIPLYDNYPYYDMTDPGGEENICSAL